MQRPLILFHSKWPDLDNIQFGHFEGNRLSWFETIPDFDHNQIYIKQKRKFSEIIFILSTCYNII